MGVQNRRATARRVFALGGLVMAIAAIVVFIADPAGDDGGAGRDAAPTGEAGSKFRGEAGPDRDTTVLDALRPVLGPPRADVPKGLPLPRAAAKVMAIGFEGTAPSAALRDRFSHHDWGALLVSDTNYVSPSQLRPLARMAERAARTKRHTPPVLAADPASIGRLGPPSPVELGAEGTPTDAQREARAAGGRLRGVGIRLVLGPSADLGIGGGPAEERAFSDDPLTAARFVRATVDGYREARVASAPGRFPGEGAASQDPLAGAATVGLSLDELVAQDLRPFAAVTGRAAAVQMSAALYVAFDGVTPASLTPDAVKLLRDRLGFEGVVVSADLVAATAATGGSVGEAAVEALRAGCDLVLIPGGREEQDAAYDAILSAARSGKIPRARLDEAVERVSRLTA